MVRLTKLSDAGELAELVAAIDVDALAAAIVTAGSQIKSNSVVTAAVEQAMADGGFDTEQATDVITKMVDRIDRSNAERFSLYMGAAGVFVTHGDTLASETIERFVAAMPDAAQWLPSA